MDEKLKHLSDKQIQELMGRYYAGQEKVGQLIHEYNIDILENKLYTLFPPIVYEEQCPYCHKPFVQNRESRTQKDLNTDNPLYCPECHHIHQGRCSCPNCIQKEEIERKKEYLEKRKLIQAEYNLSDLKPVQPDDLGFSAKIFLGALLRLCLAEDFSRILPLNSVERDLTPNAEFTNFILKQLIYDKIIAIDPNSPIEAFTGTEEKPFPSYYYPFDVNYYINFNPQHRKAIIEKLMNPPDLDLADKEKAYKLWQGIALEECEEYLKNQMQSVGFEFHPGPKTDSVFKDLLKNFSVSQIYGIIYKSISSATRYYQEHNISKPQAANSVIGACQRYGEEALNHHWELRKFRRRFELPQTMLSEFFFNRVMKIGELGFDFPPTMP